MGRLPSNLSGIMGRRRATFEACTPAPHRQDSLAPPSFLSGPPRGADRLAASCRFGLLLRPGAGLEGRMAQARAAGRPGRAALQSGPASRPMDMDRLRETIAELLLQAADFVAPARVEETARGWLSRAQPAMADPAREMLRVADSLGMATDLALFTLSASGATAFDRLARRLGRVGPEQAGHSARCAGRSSGCCGWRPRAATGWPGSRQWVTADTCGLVGRRCSTRPGLRWSKASSARAPVGCCRFAAPRRSTATCCATARRRSLG